MHIVLNINTPQVLPGRHPDLLPRGPEGTFPAISPAPPSKLQHGILLLCTLSCLITVLNETLRCMVLTSRMGMFCCGRVMTSRRSSWELSYRKIRVARHLLMTDLGILCVAFFCIIKEDGS